MRLQVLELKFGGDMVGIRVNRVWVALAVIVLFGFVLRVYALGSQPMWIDETISSLAMSEILEKGVPRFDSGLFYGRALVFHYVSAGFLWIFGGDFGARFFSVLIGTGTILLAFFIAREFSLKKGEKNNVAGLTAALFTAVLFIEIVYSRQARFYQLFQLLFFLTLFFLYKARKNKKYAWLASVSLILLVDTHLAGVVLIPFMIYVFAWEQRDWKLLIIPVLVGLYYLQGLLNVAGGSGAGLAAQYAEGYYSGIYYYLRAFAIFSLIGLIPAWMWNKRMSLLLVLPSLLLLGGVVVNKLYGLRYVYFIFLLAPILIGVLFSFIYREKKWLFIVLVVLTIAYPSNLFFDFGRMTMIYPENFRFESLSEPVLDYKSFSYETKEIVRNNRVVTLFTPGVEWYLKKPEYFIPFSLSGVPGVYTIYEGMDSYTGAEEFDGGLEGEFVFVFDRFGYVKMNDEERGRVDEILESCEGIESNGAIDIYSCNILE
jgi:hypothetical protein